MITTDGKPSPLALDLDARHVPPLVAVRQWAADALRGIGPDHLSDVLLVATELVTNAYDHAPGPASVRVTRLVTPRRVVIEVDDTSDEHPVHGRSRLGPTRGRGVQLVATLSRDWGTRRIPGGGKSVWAVIDCEAAACSREGG